MQNIDAYNEINKTAEEFDKSEFRSGESEMRDFIGSNVWYDLKSFIQVAIVKTQTLLEIADDVMQIKKFQGALQELRILEALPETILGAISEDTQELEEKEEKDE